jgi:hypothetical protein
LSDNEKTPLGPEPERLKIDLPWEQAVGRALNVPLPPGAVPERVAPKVPQRSPKK